MYVRTIEEIEEVLPTSRWKYPELLLGQIQDEEASTLEPILGTTLMEHLEGKYEELLEKFGGVTLAEIAESEKEPTKEEGIYIDLLRRCRRAVIYRMVSDKGISLSTSFNEGGGFNRMVGDGYESTSMEDLTAIKKEYWHNSMQAIDGILRILEADAKKEEPLFAEMWKESEYFWNHGDLLINNLKTLTRYVSSVKSGTRVEYIDLLPHIRYCQNSYIEQRIGQPMIDLLLQVENPIAVPGKKAPSPTLPQQRALVLVRVALGMYLMYYTAKQPQREVLTNADQAMATAEEFIKANAGEFGDAIKGAPWYEEPVEDDGLAENGNTCKCKKTYSTFCSLI